MALLLLAATTHPSRADCPAAPIADPDDMAISFLAANGVQAASASLLASTIKEGIVVYDDTNDVLKLCDGTNWIEVGSGSGGDTLASLSCSSGQIAKYNGTAWACAADGGGGSSTPVTGRAWSTGNYSPAAITTYYDLPLAGGNADLSGVTHSTSTNPERMSVSTAGKYVVSYGVNTIYNPGGSTNYARLAVNGTPVAGSDSQNSGSNTSYSSALSRAVVVTLDAGDYVTLQVMKNAGSNTFNNGMLSIASTGGGADTLSGLTCATNEIPKWNGSAWACAPDGSDGGASMTGAVMAFNASTCPDGWTEFTAARGRFLRGIDNGAGNDPDGTRTPGSAQADKVGPHTHDTTGNRIVTTSGGIGLNAGADRYWNGNFPVSATSLLSGGDVETRPKNVAVIFCQYNGTGGLGSGGSGTQVAFRAHKGGTAQAVPSSTSTKLTFSTESFDTGNNFDTTTSRFTPMVAGIYLVTGSVRCDGSTTYCQAVIMKNGAGIANHYDYHTTANMAHVTTLVSMNGSTDYLELNGVSGGAAGNINGSDTNTYFEAALISASADTLSGLSCASGEIPKWNGIAWGCASDDSSGGGTDYSASITRGSNQSIPNASWTTLTWTAEAFDNGGMADIGTSASRITIPADGAGRYVVTAQVGYVANPSNGRWMQLNKNGASAGTSHYCNTPASSSLGGAQGLGCSWIVNLAANDYIEVYTYQNSGGALDVQSGFLSAARLGASGGSDTLSGLSCATNEIPKWNGTAWACAADGGGSSGSASAGPGFYVHRNGTDQTVTTSTWTLLNWTNDDFDSTNAFDLSTDRFTPNIAGRYQFNLNAYCGAGTQCSVMLKKNSADCTVATGYVAQGYNSGSAKLATVGAILDLNGTTDFAVACVHNNGGTAINGAVYGTNFSGALMGGSGSDTLAGLSCAEGEVPEWDGSDWVCGSGLGGGGLGSVMWTATSTGRVENTGPSGPTMQDIPGLSITFTLDADAKVLAIGNGSLRTDAAGGTPQAGLGFVVDGAMQGHAQWGQQIEGLDGSGEAHAGFTITNAFDLTAGSHTIKLAAAPWGDMHVCAEGGGSLVNYKQCRLQLIAIYDNGGGYGSDTLAGLSCSAGEVPEWDGSDWVCGTGSGGSSSGNVVTGSYTGNGAASQSIALGFRPKMVVVKGINGTYKPVGIAIDGIPDGAAHSRIYASNGVAADSTQPKITATGFDAYGSTNDSSFNYSGTIYHYVAIKDGGGSGGGGSSQWTDVTGGINYAGGNVGIGTATPAATFEVDGRGRLLSAAATPPTTGKGLEFMYSSANDRGNVFAYDRDGAIAKDLGLGGSGAALFVQASGNVGIGTTTPAATALLDLTSTTKGFLPPRMTGAQRDLIASPAEGLVVYNTTTKSLDLRIASSWLSFGGSMSGSSMFSGWPDAIRCGSGANNTVLYIDNYAPSGTGIVYETPHSAVGGTRYYIIFDAAGAYSTHLNLAGYDCVTNAWSIAQLYSNGKAFNFVGGATATADGTSGQIQFNEGGNLKADAALHWDNTNKRLGIGTATPQRPFHIQVSDSGSPSIVALENIDTTNGNGAVISHRMTTTGTGASTFVEASGIRMTAVEHDHATRASGMSFWTTVNGTIASRMTINGSGNVGIGTASPETKLHIEGGPLTLKTDTKLWRIGENIDGANPGIFGLRNQTDGVNALSVLANGSVGIGTTTPGYPLQVNGGANVQLASGGMIVAGLTDSTNLAMDGNEIQARTNGAASTLHLQAKGGNTDLGNGILLVDGTTGRVGVGTGSPASTLDVRGAIRVSNLTFQDASGTVYPTNWIGPASNIDGLNNTWLHIGGITDNTDGTGAKRRLTLHGDLIHLSGNVGIGTTAPKAKAHVVGNMIVGPANVSSYGDTTHGGVGIQGDGLGGRLFITSNTSYIQEFNWQPTGTRVGSITITSGGTTFNTTSDRRVKENVSETGHGLDTLMRIPVMDFNFIADKDKKRVQGFIAQELYKIYPEAVTTNGDDGEAALSDGKGWAVDYGRITPLLVKSIQELKADNDNLRADLKAANDNDAAQDAALDELREEFDALKASLGK